MVPVHHRTSVTLLHYCSWGTPSELQYRQYKNMDWETGIRDPG